MLIITGILFLGGILYFIKYPNYLLPCGVFYLGGCISVIILLRYGKKNIADLIFITLIVTFNSLASNGYSILSASSFVFVL